LSEGLLLVK